VAQLFSLGGYGHRMKTWCIILTALFLVGCASTHQSAPPTPADFHVSPARYEAQIQSDPEVGVREHWDIANKPKWSIQKEAQWCAFRNSFSNGRVVYSEALLKQIYAECPSMREYIFAYPACSPEFLSAHFQEAYERCPHISYVMLADIVSNTNCPIELVKRVAASDSLPVGAVYPARAALKKRQTSIENP